ncbi:hypothetical protein GCM10009122_19590 [Fulvivirga kasyanovii]|nr:DUF6168 family protein [Fulvivirga kasyanovii]
MIKRFLSFTVVVVMLTVILYVVHIYLLDYMGEEMTFSLSGMYIFHFIAYFVICLSVELLNTRLPSQVGYAYLASVFIKIGVFVLIFKSAIFGANELNMTERLSVVVPMFVFLIFEAIYCGRLMNSQQA